MVDAANGNARRASDLNRDLSVNIADTNSLCRNISRGSFDVTMDVSADGKLDLVDLQRALEDIGSLPGDIDLNGVVEFAYFVGLASRFVTRSRDRWNSRDFRLQRANRVP